MFVITKDLNSRNHYVIDHNALKIVWCGSSEACEYYLKHKKFHDFYYSVKDLQGREHIPCVTLDYRELMAYNHRLFPACGWWEKLIYTTLSGPVDPDRFLECTSYS